MTSHDWNLHRDLCENPQPRKYVQFIATFNGTFGALYGPLILHTLPSSVYRTVMNSFKVTTISELLDFGQELEFETPASMNDQQRHKFQTFYPTEREDDSEQ